jgi:hypothetical protein
MMAKESLGTFARDRLKLKARYYPQVGRRVGCAAIRSDPYGTQLDTRLAAADD